MAEGGRSGRNRVVEASVPILAWCVQIWICAGRDGAILYSYGCGGEHWIWSWGQRCETVQDYVLFGRQIKQRSYQHPPIVMTSKLAVAGNSLSDSLMTFSKILSDGLAWQIATSTTSRLLSALKSITPPQTKWQRTTQYHPHRLLILLKDQLHHHPRRLKLLFLLHLPKTFHHPRHLLLKL